MTRKEIYGTDDVVGPQPPAPDWDKPVKADNSYDQGGPGDEGRITDWFPPLSDDTDPSVYDPMEEVEKSGIDSTVKASNPKDAVGSLKIPLGSVVPQQVIGGIALGMLEGSLKYGRHNSRVIGVRASVYYDAGLRHFHAWWEGQDMDPDAAIPIHHIDKLLSDLTVLRDAMLQDKWVDDRPPRVKNKNWVNDLNERARKLISLFPNPKAPYTIKDGEPE